jgi:tetratricopeptide (TPR) repeat protein
MKERINFPVAVDERSATSNDWVKASKIETFPLAFVVGDNGKITFIGSPYDEDFGDILVRTARHRYDAKLEKEANPKLEAARRARKIKNWKSAVKLYDEVIALDTTIFADVTLEKLEQYLVDMDDPSLAYAYANQLLEQYAGDPQFLIDFAHKLTTDPKISDSNRKLDLALQAARTALEITREEDKGDSLSTLALVHFHRQELDQAINFQKQAWMWAAPAHKPRYKRLLDSYQAAQQQQSAKSSAGTKPSP